MAIPRLPSATPTPHQCPRLARGMVTLAATCRRPQPAPPECPRLGLGILTLHAGADRNSNGECEVPTASRGHPLPRLRCALVATNVTLPRATLGHPLRGEAQTPRHAERHASVRWRTPFASIHCLRLGEAARRCSTPKSTLGAVAPRSGRRAASARWISCSVALKP
jgi:hypothetical protein